MGAVRIAGSLNFKKKYSAAFPVVTLGRVNPGNTITTGTLEQAGLIARDEPQRPPARAPREIAPMRSRVPSYLPDYQQILRGAPRKEDGMADRRRADFLFCKWAVERGHSIEAIAQKLLEVSPKAQERVRLKDDTEYSILTARNAAASVERERRRRAAVAGRINVREKCIRADQRQTQQQHANHDEFEHIDGSVYDVGKFF